MSKSRLARIREALVDAFKPTSLEIIDESDRHHGHPGVGNRPKETHYVIKIQADEFKDMNRVDAHRRVYDAIDPEFKLGIHAVSVKFVDPK